MALTLRGVWRRVSPIVKVLRELKSQQHRAFEHTTQRGSDARRYGKNARDDMTRLDVIDVRVARLNKGILARSVRLGHKLKSSRPGR